MHQSLNTIAEDFSRGHEKAAGFPWERLRYEHTQMIRARLASGTHRLRPTRCSRAPRHLKECWRLGKLDVEALHRACDLDPIRSKRLPTGKALTEEQLDVLLMHATVCETARSSAS